MTIYCKHCRQPIAINYGDSIAFGDVRFFEPIKFRHDRAQGGCGRVNRWHPAKAEQPADAQNKPLTVSASETESLVL